MYASSERTMKLKDNISDAADPVPDTSGLPRCARLCHASRRVGRFFLLVLVVL